MWIADSCFPAPKQTVHGGAQCWRWNFWEFSEAGCQARVLLENPLLLNWPSPSHTHYDKLTSEKSLSKCSQRANSRLMRSWKLWILMRVCLDLWRQADVMCFTFKKNLNEKIKFCVFEYNTCTLQTLKQYNCKWKFFPFSLTHILCFAVCTVLWQKPSFVPGMNEGMCVCEWERDSSQAKWQDAGYQEEISAWMKWAPTFVTHMRTYTHSEGNQRTKRWKCV